MEKDTAIAFLKQLGAKTIDLDRLPWVQGNCPLAPWRHQKGTDSDPSFGIETGKLAARCHCFSCHFNGTPESTIAEIMMQAKVQKIPHGLDLQKAMQIIENEVVSIVMDEPEQEKGVYEYPESWLASFPSLVYSADGMAYVQKRGFGPKDVERDDVRWDPIRRRVCFPIRTRYGELYGMQGRAVDPDNEPRYWAYLAPGGGKSYNVDNVLGEGQADLDRPVVGVEGPFDWWRCRQAGLNAVCFMGTGIRESQLARLVGMWMFISLFDPDKAGQLATSNVRKMLKKCKVVGPLLQGERDPGEMGVDELQLLISPYDPTM